MPIHEYKCDACNATCEFIQSFSEGYKRKCPSCGKLKLKRQVATSTGLIFKGSDWFTNRGRENENN